MNALEAASHALFGVELGRSAPVVLLVSARALPLAWLAPWLGWRGNAASVRVMVALVVALALTPLALAQAPRVPGGWLPLLLMGLREALVGTAFAIAASVPLWALGWAGDLLDRWRGSPSDGSARGEGLLGTLHVSAGVVFFVSVGGHRLAIAAFGGSLVDAPVGTGAALALSSFALGTARLVTAALELALALAAPAAVAFLLLEGALALAGRVAPTLRPWVLGMPLRAALGVAIASLGLSAALPRMSGPIAGSIEAATELVRRLAG